MFVLHLWVFGVCPDLRVYLLSVYVFAGNQAAAYNVRTTCGPMLFSDLLSIPIHRFAKPFFKINRHSIAERLPRSLN